MSAIHRNSTSVDGPDTLSELAPRNGTVFSGARIDGNLANKLPHSVLACESVMGFFVAGRIGAIAVRDRYSYDSRILHFFSGSH
ncbi:hypothetical protein L6164_028304 [Bauhinia variegata]|uniref:Uncharacterized protein n=1 Tax=Bauhinia variegata TaxID=167791 RepID=A0ACB9LW00_BAUVA|nr:hypothetical protein L6164_028304 [Bauhinia variegata]